MLTPNIQLQHQKFRQFVGLNQNIVNIIKYFENEGQWIILYLLNHCIAFDFAFLAAPNFFKALYFIKKKKLSYYSIVLQYYH